MKKRKIKVCLLLIVILILSGCSMRPEYTYEKKETLCEYDNLNKIEIYDNFAPIRIEGSNNEKIEISYYEADNDNEYYDIRDNNDGVLVIERVDPDNGQGIFVFGEKTNHKDVVLNIKIPNNFIGEIEITCSDHSIDIENLEVENLLIKSIDTEIIINNLVVDQKLVIEGKDEDILLEDINVRDQISITNKDGNINGSFMKNDNIYYGSENVSITSKEGSVNINYFEQ